MLSTNEILIWNFIRMTILFFPITFIGAFLSHLLQELGIFRKIEPCVKNFTKIFNIPTFLIPAVISCFINLRLEHVIVYSYYSKGYFDDKYLIYYNLLMSPLRHVNIMLCYSIPISISALGFYTGSIYLALLYIKSLLTALLGIIYGFVFVKPKILSEIEELGSNILKIEERKKFRIVLKNSISYGLRILKRLSIRFGIIISIMFLLTIFGIFQLINDYLSILIKPLFEQFNFKSEFITLVIVATVYPMIAPFIGGSFLESNLLTPKDVIIALLLGGMLFMIFFDFTRHSFPFYASIYPIKIAVKLTLSLIIANVITTPIVILIAYLLPI